MRVRVGGETVTTILVMVTGQAGVSDRVRRRLERLADAPEIPIVPVVDRWPGRTSRGGAFPGGQASGGFEALEASVPISTRFVLLGERTRRVGRLRAEPLTWVVTWTAPIGSDEDDTGIRMKSWIPHPEDGWWDTARNEVRGSRFLRAVLA